MAVATGLRVSGISVAYPSGLALDGVSVDFQPGQVHVLAGENGAGKSTLIRVLTGNRAPDRGEMWIDDAPFAPRSAREAATGGVRAVYQELELFGALTVWENVIAGDWGDPGWIVNRAAMIERADAAIRQSGDPLPLHVPVHRLTPAEQQRVVIARALAARVRFVVLDEPTATLSRPERADLLARIRSLAESGVGVIFVSHHLDEAFAVGSVVTVLRDGRVVWTRPIREVSEAQIKDAMFGPAREPAVSGAATGERRSQLRLEDVRWGRGIHSLTTSLDSGGVIGIAGLPGSGADELLRSLLLGPRAGAVTINGVPLPPEPRAWVRLGVGYVPADRRSDGLFLDLAAEANVVSANLGAVSSGGVFRAASSRRLARQAMEALNIHPLDLGRAARQFSGGNQQKLVLGRWFAADTGCLLADEPTRGVDAASKVEIHGILRALAREATVVVYSSDLAELSDLCSRVLVFGRDGSVADLAPVPGADLIFHAMTERRQA